MTCPTLHPHQSCSKRVPTLNHLLRFEIGFVANWDGASRLCCMLKDQFCRFVWIPGLIPLTHYGHDHGLPDQQFRFLRQLLGASLGVKTKEIDAGHFILHEHASWLLAEGWWWRYIYACESAVHGALLKCCWSSRSQTLPHNSTSNQVFLVTALIQTAFTFRWVMRFNLSFFTSQLSLQAQVSCVSELTTDMLTQLWGWLDHTRVFDFVSTKYISWCFWQQPHKVKLLAHIARPEAKLSMFGPHGTWLLCRKSVSWQPLIRSR